MSILNNINTWKVEFLKKLWGTAKFDIKKLV